jgi:phosphoesterase RecJ-like protein
VAQILLLGIYGDTGGFAYPATKAPTFSAAAELITIAPGFFKLYDSIRNNEDFDRIRFLGLGITKAERFFDGKLIISAISAADLTEKQIPLPASAGSGLASTLRGAAGALAAITLLEEKVGGPIKLSARSRDGEVCDVSQIAAQFGGGGHKAAAGALISGRTLAQAVEEVKQVFAAQLDVD